MASAVPENTAQSERGVDQRPSAPTATANATWLLDRLVCDQPLVVEHGGLAGRTHRGHQASRVDLHGDVQSVVAGVGQALAALHEVPIVDAPLDRGWNALQRRVERTLADVDVAALPEPYCRYDVDELFRIWCAGRPDGEDLVVSHGNPTLENISLHGGRLSGFVALAEMRVADRHLDLAIVQQSLHHHVGGEGVFIFLDAYGIDPDLIRLDHYMLASLLLR